MSAQDPPGGMPAPPTAGDATGLTPNPIDPRAVTAAVRSSRHGAILTFEGVGRNEFEGRPVLALEYEAWEPVAEAELRAITQEAQARWPVTAVIVHRTGRVEIGEPSVVIAVGASHRGEAYEASRYCIEQLKARVTIWKKEIYADGGEWIANTPPAAADPSSGAAE
ncbi:MAG: molybdenum cofactor biosynthesis protein MoaE [Myxococcales bacterium]|nr:molybdenum cofactor biosynthesis protein MoaE [Myxococcales bacterium]